MSDDWILDVLADLKSFAEQNGLPHLAGNLEDTQRLAAIELSARVARDTAEAPAPRGARRRPIILRAWPKRSGGLDS